MRYDYDAEEEYDSFVWAFKAFLVTVFLAVVIGVTAVVIV